MTTQINHLTQSIIFLLALLSISTVSLGQDKLYLDRYTNGMEYIKKNKEIAKYRDKHFNKKAATFRISEDIIPGFKPLLYLRQLEKVGITKDELDSLLVFKRDSSYTIPFLPKYSNDRNADYVLYFGRPYKNTILTVIEFSPYNNKEDKYYGLGNHPLIILLVFDSEEKVKTAVLASPIFD